MDCGPREEQKALVASGASQTLNSMHRPQADGFGHAVDLVPYINGKLRWEWPAIYPIAAAVWQASRELGVPIRWGGAWINMVDIKSGTSGAMKAAVEAYGSARCKARKSAFTRWPALRAGPMIRALLATLAVVALIAADQTPEG